MESKTQWLLEKKSSGLCIGHDGHRYLLVSFNDINRLVFKSAEEAQKYLENQPLFLKVESKDFEPREHQYG